jgi:hypothetical protein
LEHRRPCSNYLPTRSDESKSSAADGYQSIGEYLAKTLIDRKAAKLVRPETWSKKRSITSSINFVATHCTIALQVCPILSVVENLPFNHRRPLGWRFGVD